MPEKWLKTNFEYQKDWDPKRKAIVKNCTGPGSSETVYTLEFNEANLKQLFDKRENDHIHVGSKRRTERYRKTGSTRA